MTDTMAFNNDDNEKYPTKKFQVKEWGKASICGNNYTPNLYVATYRSAAFPLFGVFFSQSRWWKHLSFLWRFNTTYGAAETTAAGKKKETPTPRLVAPHTTSVLQWRFYVGARGAEAPQILPSPPPLKFSDTVVLLLVELIGSIVNFA